MDKCEDGIQYNRVPEESQQGFDAPANVSPSRRYPLSKRRYQILAAFSFGAMMNNMICFSLSPVSSIASGVFGSKFRVAMLAQVFFFTYALLSFPSAIVTSHIGLKKAVISAAWLQALGATLRCVLPQNYAMIMLGQAIASTAQCAFVNLPAEISLRWFSAEERIIATTVAVNSNSFGIAMAYIFTPFVTISAATLANSLILTAALSIAGAIFISVTFDDGPKFYPSKAAELRCCNGIPTMNTPTTASPHSRDRLDEEDGLVEVKLSDLQESMMIMHYNDVSEALVDRSPPKEVLDSTRGLIEFVILICRQAASLKGTGFFQMALVFCSAEVLLNCFSCEIGTIMHTKHLPRTAVQTAGVLFVTLCLLGSALLSVVLRDRHQYLSALWVLQTAVIFAAAAVDYSPASDELRFFLIFGLFAVFLGPIQPIALECAAEFTFPFPESIIATLMQVTGNCLSAALLPIFVWFCHYGHFGPPVGVALSVVLLLSMLFEPRYRREEQEQPSEDRADYSAVSTYRREKAFIPFSARSAARLCSTPRNYLLNHSQHFLYSVD